MKKLIFGTFGRAFCFALFIFCCAMPAFAQDGPPDLDSPEVEEKFKSLRIALITEQINLTSEQAEKFWPVFNEFSKEKREIQKQLRELGRKTETANDDEIKTGIDKMFELRQKELDLDKSYHAKFLKVINHRQVAALYKSEMMFRKKLLEKLGERRGKPGRF